MSYTQQGDAPLRIVLEVASHDALTELFQTIRTADVDVRTEAISPAALSASTTVTLDLDILTEKQRDTLELALREGYYERPRESDLGTLADTLGISKSAVSQRIRNAEIKLITSALEPYCC